jgi:uncharacterized protein (UPF0333 family)
MARLRAKKKAQSTLEYAILIGVLVAALIAMQVYLKRGYQGKLREGADQMGEQFSPQHTTYNYTTNSFTNSTETLYAQDLGNEATTQTEIHNQTTQKTGDEDVQMEDKEEWFTANSKSK